MTVTIPIKQLTEAENRVLKSVKESLQDLPYITQNTIIGDLQKSLENQLLHLISVQK
jgi:hypothetical protein